LFGSAFIVRFALSKVLLVLDLGCAITVVHYIFFTGKWWLCFKRAWKCWVIDDFGYFAFIWGWN